MKTRIFTLLAVMMLASISAFAQSVEPIKGDVNGDGRVNVADIASIIDIIAKGEAGYFYFGNVRPTAENYTSLPGVIGSYTSISEASGATATIAAGETLYMMCPASWMEGKSVELEDESGNPISFLEEKDAITISGYVIYRTQALNDEKTVVLKTYNSDYYWYVGTTQPTDPTDSAQNTGLNKWTSLGSNLPTSSIKVVKEDPTYADHTWYIAAPTAANFVMYNILNTTPELGVTKLNPINIGNVSYDVWKTNSEVDICQVYLHK